MRKVPPLFVFCAKQLQKNFIHQTKLQTLSAEVYNYVMPLWSQQVFNSSSHCLTLLTPLSSCSVVLFLCLPLSFFTNSFSQEAWSSFNMLFPALITLAEERELEREAR